MQTFHQLIIVTVLGVIFTACGQVNTAQTQGATSSSGILATSLEVDCHSVDVADAGFNILVRHDRAQGTHLVMIEEIWLGGVRNPQTIEVTVRDEGERFEVRGEGFALDIQQEAENDVLPARLQLYQNTVPEFSQMACRLVQVPAEHTAVEAAMYGIGPGVDMEVYESMLRTFGDAIGSGDFTVYRLRDFGFEGGATACAQLSPFAYDTALTDLVAALRALEPDPQTTSYTVRTVINCD